MVVDSTRIDWCSIECFDILAAVKAIRIPRPFLQGLGLCKFSRKK